jgi:hypothetical protein
VLYNAGYHTITSLANADVIDIELVLKNAAPFQRCAIVTEYQMSNGSGTETRSTLNYASQDEHKILSPYLKCTE